MRCGTKVVIVHEPCTSHYSRKELKASSEKVLESAKGPVDYELLVFNELDQKEYANAVFWTEAEWRTDKKSKNSAGVTKSKGNKVKEPSKNYLTDVTGAWVGSIKVNLVQKEARRLFSAIESDSREKTPLTWDRNASSRQRNFFRVSLERKFSFLKLCADGWKVEQLAKDLYPGYRQNRPLGKKVARVEQAAQTDNKTQDIDLTQAHNASQSPPSTEASNESLFPPSIQVSEPNDSELQPLPSTTNKRRAEDNGTTEAASKRARTLVQFADPLYVTIAY